MRAWPNGSRHRATNSEIVGSNPTALADWPVAQLEAHPAHNGADSVRTRAGQHGGIAQMEELRAYTPSAGVQIPLPLLKTRSRALDDPLGSGPRPSWFDSSLLDKHLGVAKSGMALRLGRRDRGFESLHLDQRGVAAPGF